uniref:RAB5A, member RAS oncogene family n=1 Tax=Molossus molossus TaxID=27622 RepID=A0A7J8E0Q8_MOLMO|nr:hypothetical protein HJG59_000149 [Molossus molossus]
MAGQGGAAGASGLAAGNKTCQCKLVLLVESEVGKSNLVLRLVKGQFHKYQENVVGVAFLTQTFCLDDTTRYVYTGRELGAGVTEAASPNTFIALSGNEADLASKTAMEFQEARAYADDNSLLFLESAKKAMNVNKISMAIAKKLPKNEPQNAAGTPGWYQGMDLQGNNPTFWSQCSSN